MRTVCVCWATVHEHGDLWWQHHTMRQKLFVEKMGWNVPSDGLAEWDQYDTPATLYAITHIDGKVVAASRLNRCDRTMGSWSYMIKDAALGKLEGIPADILGAAPDDARCWEATRFTADPTLSREQRTTALAANAQDLAKIAVASQADRMIALMPPAFIRWLTSIGLPCHRLGPTVKTDQNDRICVIEMPLTTFSVEKSERPTKIAS